MWFAFLLSSKVTLSVVSSVIIDTDGDGKSNAGREVLLNVNVSTVFEGRDLYPCTISYNSLKVFTAAMDQKRIIGTYKNAYRRIEVTGLTPQRYNIIMRCSIMFL